MRDLEDLQCVWEIGLENLNLGHLTEDNFLTQEVVVKSTKSLMNLRNNNYLPSIFCQMPSRPQSYTNISSAL